MMKQHLYASVSITQQNNITSGVQNSNNILSLRPSLSLSLSHTHSLSLFLSLSLSLSLSLTHRLSLLSSLSLLPPLHPPPRLPPSLFHLCLSLHHSFSLFSLSLSLL